MPLLRKITLSSGSILGIWSIEESIDALLETGINSGEVTDSIKRQLERLACSALLSEIFNEHTISISHNPLGKPLLSNDWNISISHSKKFVAILVNKDVEVGVDIQVPKSSISKAADSFISPDEKQHSALPYTTRNLHICWCAKEALYKRISDSALNIYSDFWIKAFDDSENTGNVQGLHLPSQATFGLSYEVHESFYLVFTTD